MYLTAEAALGSGLMAELMGVKGLWTELLGWGLAMGINVSKVCISLHNAV